MWVETAKKKKKKSSDFLVTIQKDSWALALSSACPPLRYQPGAAESEGSIEALRARGVK